MFGPQSAAVLSPGIFLAAQVFDKETGKDDQRRRETTTVYSAGFKPIKTQPISIALVLPVTFASGVAAYTPIDDEAKGKLFSLQLGVSEERTFASEENGLPLADSGASGLFMHPGIVFSVSPSVQFFGLVSLPLTQQYSSIVDRQRFRLGTGIIWILKHSGT